VLSGATADQSVANLQALLDAEAASFSVSHCFVIDPNGQRVPECFHNMSMHEQAQFRSYLGAKLLQWDTQAVMANQSCGWFIEVAGENGIGRGQFMMTIHHLGPFHG